MTSSIRTLVRRILIVLLVILLPSAARSQETAQPAQAVSPAPETQAADPAGTTSPQQQAAPAPASEVSVPDQAPAGQEAAEGTYIIKQGDTLWDISSAFLKDPFLWPFIWKANPSITNADLIYPGNSLVIPSMAPIERALAAPAPAPVQEKTDEPAQPAPVAAAPAPQEESDGGLFGRKMPVRANGPVEEERISKLLLPETVQLPLADKYTVLRAGFVGFDESKDRIIGIVGAEKTIFSYNDIVYVNMVSTQAAPGDKFLIFTALHPVRHPVSGARYGKLIRIDGVLEIIAPGSGGNYTARIILSFDTANRSSMLTPYQDPPLLYGKPSAKNKDIEGYVLDIRQDQTISSQFDCVYLDKGTADGVELGDSFVIYNTVKPVKKAAYPKNKVGEAQVIVVKEKTATAIVNNSLNTLVVGDRFEYKR